jgi:tripartite-type tricarboxylate transporter receptor subunit TctC
LIGRTWLAAIALPLASVTVAVHAQSYPARAVRLIVPFPPGGPNDVLGRVVAQKLTEQMGQQVVVDNRGGAGGIIGAELAARATPDGYTLFFGGTASMSINPILHKKLGYDPVADFAAVSLIGTAPSLLSLHPSLPIKNVKELIEAAKAKTASAHVRVVRRRHGAASRGRTVQYDGRRDAGARALSRWRPRLHRSAGRPGRDVFRRHFSGAAVRERR